MTISYFKNFFVMNKTKALSVIKTKTKVLSSIKTKTKAFTVIEIMIAITILASVFILAFGAFKNTAKRSKETDYKNILTQEVRLLMNRIKNDIKNCRGTHSDYVQNNALTGTPPLEVFPGSSPWEWKIYDDTDSEKTVKYTLDGNNVTRESGGISKIMSKHITNLEMGPEDISDFTKASIIKISIEAEYEDRSIPQPVVYSQKSVAVISDLSNKGSNKNWKSNF